MDEQLIGQVIGGFIVGPLIAVGGMGRIYQALDERTRQTAAIKVLMPEYARDENFRTRFWREAELMSTLNHPHIIPIYRYGEWSDYLYMVMKLIQGPSLERVLQFRTFTPLSAWTIVRPVTEALGFGHQLQVLHRDLKTANILLDTTENERRPHVYLSDFGLGKRPGFDRTLTANGISVGTPEYMAPEVAMGQPADQRADLYSMGVMIYEMLLGHLPFQGSSAQMTALAHVDHPVPRPRMLRPDFPRPLEALLLRALDKQPNTRFQTADDLRLSYFDTVQSLDPLERQTCYWIKRPREGKRSKSN